MASTTLNDRFPFRLFFLLFAALALLILGGAWYVSHERISSELEITQSNEIGSVVMGVRRLDDELHQPFHHLLALLDEANVKRAIDADSGSVDGMAAAFASLIRYNRIYDKVRWIDQTGMEQVRVNALPGNSEIVARERLQDQSASYYFSHAMRLTAGQVYISPLDLNVEQGMVEVPHKPILRLATPVQDGLGRARGVLVLDVAAKHLLDSFTDSLVGARDHVMLLNSDGHWLVSPNADEAWGFMFQREKTLASEHPEAWREITQIPSGQVENAGGLWTWSSVYPLKDIDSRAIADIPNWLVVAHLPASQMTLIRQGAWQAVGINTLVLLILFGILAAWLARAMTSRTRARIAAAEALVKAAEANRLAAARNRFRLVVEANTNGLLVADRTGRIVLTNPALERMFGYEPGEMLGQPLSMLLPDSVKAGHAEKFTQFMDAPLARPMGSGRELHGRRKDGGEFPVEISLSPFTEDGESYVDAFVADISRRKQVEALHRQSETRLRLLLETNPNGLLLVDDTGRIQMTNPALDKMFGYAPGELLEMPLETLVPSELQMHHVNLRAQYLEHPVIRTMGAGLVLHGRHKSAGNFPIQVSLASFEESGRTFVQATVVDMSARTAS
jgi:PAS domain S-box-containing protein